MNAQDLLDPQAALDVFGRAFTKIRCAERGGVQVPLPLRSFLGGVVELVNGGLPGRLPIDLAFVALDVIAAQPQEWREAVDRLAPLGVAPDGVPENFD